MKKLLLGLLGGLCLVGMAQASSLDSMGWVYYGAIPLKPGQPGPVFKYDVLTKYGAQGVSEAIAACPDLSDKSWRKVSVGLGYHCDSLTCRYKKLPEYPAQDVCHLP